MIRTSLYWDDLEVGQGFRSRTRTITEADVVQFAGSTGDHAELHVSEQTAATGQFGGRIAHGLLVLSYAHGLMLGGGLLRHSAVAFLGISEWKFSGPVLLGDTIHVDFEVAEKRLSSSLAGRGIVTFSVAVLNQNDERVQYGNKSLLLSTKSVPERQERVDS